MFHYVGNVQNTTGDALAGYYVKLSDPSNGAAILLYSDVSATPIVTTSGLANAAKADSTGSVSFFVTEGLYNVNTYRSDGITLLRSDLGVPFGNAESNLLFTGIGTRTIPAPVNVLTTAGYSVDGKGAAKYVRDGTATWSTQGTAFRAAAITAGIAAATVDASLTATEGRFRKADASGVYWKLSTDQFVNSNMLGALHDAVYTSASAWNLRWTGTDDRLAIQALLDWSIYFGGTPQVRLSPGYALIGATLHQGYGNQFSHCELVGSDYDHNDGYNLNSRGSGIARNFVGDPAINIQGARNNRIDQIHFYGTHFTYFRDNGFASFGNACVVDDTDLTLWYDPTIQTALGRSVDYRYAPDAAITLDAYSGTRPGISYSTVTYPAWLGAASLTQWGKNLSSGIKIATLGCTFSGEVNCIVTHPSGSDGNGDFIDIGTVHVQNSKRFLSVSHTQCRTVTIRYGAVNFAGECFANNVHGLQTGELDGQMRLHGSNVMRAGSIGSQLYSGTLTIHDSYFEALYQLFDTAGGQFPTKFFNTRAAFDMQNDGFRPVPAFCVTGQGIVHIDGGLYANFPALFAGEGIGMVTGGALFDGKLTGVGAGTIAPHLANMHQATAGGVVFVGGTRGPWSSQHINRNIDTGAIAAPDDLTNTSYRTVNNGLRVTSRPYGIPIHVDFAGQTSNVGLVGNIMVANPWGGQPTERLHANGRYDKPGTFTAASSTSTTTAYEYLFTYSYTAGNPNAYGGAAGDLIYDKDSKIFFLARSYTVGTKAVIWRALTGIKKVATLWTPITAFTTASGLSLTAWNLRRYVPEIPVIADFTSASGNLTNLMSPDGVVLNAATITIGDHIDLDDKNDGLGTTPNNVLTAFNAATKTASITATASRTVARLPLPRFIRIVANG